VFFITLYFLQKDPKLIESRLRAGPAAEQQTSQKIIQALASIFFILPFIISSLDRRFGWSNIPFFLVVVGDILVALGLFFVFLVFQRTHLLPRRSNCRRNSGSSPPDRTRWSATRCMRALF
jgi:protein-S-isoprenylcysteine O-methyltransferase Ste14